ncbi:transposase [Candidatus Kaiserbacteria bacterium]|nr:transposase [Candidatus Kaiserbacteria bacterium]
MERKITFTEDEYYHLYNRGVEKRCIFMDKNDRLRFVRLLIAANSDQRFVFRDIEHKHLGEIPRGNPLVAIGAYVLMSNHFHILVKEIRDGGISAFMEKLQTGYASYFNRRHSRVGALFQGTFRAQHVDSDRFLKYLFSYIHLNPIKTIEPQWKEDGIKDRRRAWKFLKEYADSSFADYSGAKRDRSIILSPDAFPAYFSSHSDFTQHIDDWFDYRNILYDT